MTDLLSTLPEDTVVVTVPVDAESLPGFIIIHLVKAEPPPAPALRWPTGKGYFIWMLPRCAGGSPSGLAAACKSAGLQWVTIKVSEAGGPFGGNIKPWVDELRDAGVAVWGWGYVYGAKPEAEADIAAARVKEFGLDGWMIDAESEYKAPGKAAAAKTYTLRLRNAIPDKGIGLCSYRYPSLHRELPWAEFITGCDFHCPQVYWISSKATAAPGVQLEKSVAELKALRDLPIIPVGVACDNPISNGGNWRPTVAQINNFDSTAQQMGLPGVSWWSYQHAEAIPEFWNAIAGHKWGQA